MSDVFLLAGATVTLADVDALPTRVRERFGQGPPTMTIQRRAIALVPESSDTWMGQTWAWSNSGTTYFTGVIRSRSVRRGEVGWIIDYQAIGASDSLDKFPITDATTSLDVSPFNCAPEDLINYRPANAGRTVGQILTSVLTSLTNGANMLAYGLGGLTGPSGDVYVLPTATVTDLAALTIIPPKPVYVTGEKFGSALSGFLQAMAPNVRMWVQPDGTIRFLDLTTFAAAVQTLTMGVDPIEPTEISRDVGDCWQRVMIRGAPIAVMAIFKQSNGTLTQNFGYGSVSNAAAITGWVATDFSGTTASQDTGTCTMSSTTTVVVHSSSATATWPSDYWDQTSTGAHGTVNLYDTVNPGVTSIWTSPIVANGTLTAGGTCTLTLSVPAPVTTYDDYTISGLTAGASLTWRRYQIADSTLWPLVVAQSTYPQPFVNGGGGAVMISTPMGAVFWPQSGSSPPYNMFPLPFQVDDSGNVVFVAPTYVCANNSVPADVWAAIPINTAPNQVFSPVNTGSPPTTPAYAGDSNTIEGLTDTLPVTMPDWRDPGQVAQVQALADDWLKSVQDGVREGEIVYHGLWTPALSFGICMNINLVADGTTGTSGWEAAFLPVVGYHVEFSQGPDDYLTTIVCSSRRAHYSAEMFLRPERSMRAFGLSSGSDAVQFGGMADTQHAYGDASAANAANASSAMPSAQSINANMSDAGYGSATDHAGNASRQEGTATGSGAGNDIVGNAAAAAGAGMGPMQTSIGSPQAGMGNAQEGMGNPQEGIGGQQQGMMPARRRAQAQEREQKARKKREQEARDAQEDARNQGGGE